MTAMKTTKRLIRNIILLTVIASLLTMPSTSADQTSDTFDITVTGEWIWINVTNTSWALGTVSMSTLIYTNETGVTFIADMDNCTVNTDLKLQVTADGATWNSATAGNPPNADVYRLNASIDIWVADDNQIVTASQTTISTNIVAGNNETFDLRFDTPTSTTTASQQTMTITATVVKN